MRSLCISPLSAVLRSIFAHAPRPCRVFSHHISPFFLLVAWRVNYCPCVPHASMSPHLSRHDLQAGREGVRFHGQGFSRVFACGRFPWPVANAAGSGFWLKWCVCVVLLSLPWALCGGECACQPAEPSVHRGTRSLRPTTPPTQTPPHGSKRNQGRTGTDWHILG